MKSTWTGRPTNFSPRFDPDPDIAEPWWQTLAGCVLFAATIVLALIAL